MKVYKYQVLKSNDPLNEEEINVMGTAGYRLVSVVHHKVSVEYGIPNRYTEIWEYYNYFERGEEVL